MKIIHIIIGKANPERQNGVNKAVHSMATQMVKNGQDVEVWGLTATPDEPTTKRDYPLHIFDVMARSFTMNPLISEAIDALPEKSIIHFHGGFIPAFYRIATHLKKKNMAWIMSPHGSYMRQSLQRNRLAKIVYLGICEKFLLQNAKSVHVLTDLEELETKAVCSKAFLTSIPNAYSEEEDTAKVSFTEIYTHAKPVFCYMGRLDKVHKGLDLLFDGFKNYLELGGQGELWLIGDGPHQQRLQRHAARRNIAQHVRFWGARFGQEKINILKNAHVFVHTSRWEGMPMSILEAAAHSRPLLISKGTGMAKAVEKWKAGIVLEENTASDIAKAMLECQQLQKLGKLGDIGYQAADMIKNDFVWDKIVQTMNDTLYKVA